MILPRPGDVPDSQGDSDLLESLFTDIAADRAPPRVGGNGGMVLGGEPRRRGRRRRIAADRRHRLRLKRSAEADEGQPLGFGSFVSYRSVSDCARAPRGALSCQAPRRTDDPEDARRLRPVELVPGQHDFTSQMQHVVRPRRGGGQLGWLPDGVRPYPLREDRVHLLVRSDEWFVVGVSVRLMSQAGSRGIPRRRFSQPGSSSTPDSSRNPQITSLHLTGSSNIAV